MSEFLKTLNAILWKSYWAPVPLQTLGGIEALFNEHAVRGLPTAPAAPQPYAHPRGSKAWAKLQLPGHGAAALGQGGKGPSEGTAVLRRWKIQALKPSRSSRVIC